MYLEKQKLIIISTRKCGTNSMLKSLNHYLSPKNYHLYSRGTLSGHLPINHSKQGIWTDTLAENNDVYLMIRNPFDKIVSNYFYFKKGIRIWSKELSF